MTESTKGGAAAAGASAGASGQRLEDLAQIIRAYTDVTDRLQHSHDALLAQVARLQEELAGKDATLQRSKRLAALGEMAAGIAHEIRNPLGAIHLYAGQLGQDLTALAREGDARQRPTLSTAAGTAAKIATAVRGLNAIVNDVLSFARELRPRLEAAEVSALFDRAVESQRPALTAAAVTVCRLDAPARRGAAAPRIHADAGLVHQALVNLIRNAVEAMTARSSAGRSPASAGGVLTLAARREGQHTVLAVRDNGPGIAEDDVDRIFNPFFTTRNTGTGLGLAIVHRIVDAHGGAISVHNDGGAVFELSLPAVARNTDFKARSSPSRSNRSDGRGAGAVVGAGSQRGPRLVSRRCTNSPLTRLVLQL